MELRHIPIGELKIAAVNMRHGRKEPDISDILPSVRARGILQPLLVRPNGEGYEIVAGRRRYFCAKAVEAERGEIEPLPCAVMEPGDDAGALEASLIENLARLDPDEMSQYETFVRLAKEGKSIAEIAGTFGITEIMVKRRFALGNLLPRIRELYRNEEIDFETIQHLTLAAKARQKEWLTLFDDPGSRAPQGYQVKQWLFGGQSISTKVALFPLEEYDGQIVGDLFEEDAYFADADLFWELQNKAIAAKRDALLAAGWTEVLVLETGQHFQAWQHEKTPKKKGGKVFVTVSHRGEVEIHEGYLDAKEARRSRKRGDGKDKGEDAIASAAPPRPAMTKAMQNYLELHRHAVARLALLAHPGTALRLLVAHAVAASGHWQVKAEPQQAKSEAIAKSIAGSPAQQAFRRRAGGDAQAIRPARLSPYCGLGERRCLPHGGRVRAVVGDDGRGGAAGRGLYHGRDTGGGQPARRGGRRASQGRCPPVLAARRRLLRACARACHRQRDASGGRGQAGRRRQPVGAGQDAEADHPRLPRWNQRPRQGRGLAARFHGLSVPPLW